MFNLTSLIMPDSFLPASLVSSILYFSLEVYAVARVMLLLSVGLKMRDIIQDIRVLRPVALVFVSLVDA